MGHAMEDVEITLTRTADQWLMIADGWHWRAVEFHETDHNDTAAATCQSFANYCLQRTRTAPQH
jgi:hypothetical protein